MISGLGLDLTSKHDSNDPTSVPEGLRSKAESIEGPARQVAANETTSLRGLRIGIPQVRKNYILAAKASRN